MDGDLKRTFGAVAALHPGALSSRSAAAPFRQRCRSSNPATPVVALERSKDLATVARRKLARFGVQVRVDVWKAYVTELAVASKRGYGSANTSRHWSRNSRSASSGGNSGTDRGSGQSRRPESPTGT
jgi:hypothetical protein